MSAIDQAAMEHLQFTGEDTLVCDMTDANLLRATDEIDQEATEDLQSSGEDTPTVACLLKVTDKIDEETMEDMQSSGEETSICGTTDPRLLGVTEKIDQDATEDMQFSGEDTPTCVTMVACLLKVTDKIDEETMEDMQSSGEETSICGTTDASLFGIIGDIIDEGATEELQNTETSTCDTTDASLFGVTGDLIDEGATEELQPTETSTCDTTDASLFRVTQETENLVRPIKICYEGRFFEKYTTSKFLGMLPAKIDRELTRARRTSWFENRRFLFDKITQTAEDVRSSDVLEQEEDEVGVGSEAEILKNETLESAETVEEEELTRKEEDASILSIDQQTILENEIIEELRREKNEFDQQVNGHVYQNEKEFMIESKQIEGSSSIQRTKDTLMSTENYAKEETLGKEDQINEKAKKLLGMSDDVNKPMKENGGKTNSSNGPHGDSSKRSSNVFTEVKQKITRQLSRTLSFRKKSTSKSKRDSNNDDVTWILAPKNAEEYPMHHQRRGVAVIFNHNVFERLAPRHSTERECHDLAVQLTTLEFEVQIYQDLKLAQLKSVLLKTSEMDHSDADCFLVIVLTVRQHGSLFAKDLPYDENILLKRFTGDKCSTLAGKPKILLIDACREVQAAKLFRTMADATDSLSVSHMVPIEADILTVTWYYPCRDATQGSWFVRALCDELGANAQTRDLLTLLTFVNRRVALLCAAVEGVSEHRKDEVPTFTSMLTRQVYFRSKNSHNEVEGS